MTAVDPRPLLLIGARGLAVEVIECAHQLGREVVGCLDDDPTLAGTTPPNGVPVVGTTDAIATIDALSDSEESDIVVCVGHGSVRKRVIERLISLGVAPHRFVSLIHPTAVVPASTVIGAGSILLAGVVITAPIAIGAHVVVMPNVTMTHDDVVDDYVTLASGVSLGGTVRVGAEAYLGMNSAVRENCTVGEQATLGMGSALVRDLPAGQTWAGVPAAPLESSADHGG